MSNGHILVVEDDESLRRVTQAQLERAGYDASAAVDLAQAMEILQTQGRAIKVVRLLPPVGGSAAGSALQGSEGRASSKG